MTVNFYFEHVLHVLNKIGADCVLHAMRNMARASEGHKIEVDHVTNEGFHGTVIVESTVEVVLKDFIEWVVWVCGQAKILYIFSSVQIGEK